MTVYAITDTKNGRTGIAPTYLQTTQPFNGHINTAEQRSTIQPWVGCYIWYSDEGNPCCKIIMLD